MGGRASWGPCTPEGPLILPKEESLFYSPRKDREVHPGPWPRRTPGSTLPSQGRVWQAELKPLRVSTP